MARFRVQSVFVNALYDHIQETVAHIRLRTDFVPDVGIVLGSGLGPLADDIEMVSSFPYAELPHFPRSTAPGHEGRLIFGRLEDKNVVAYKGRVHLYEGYTASQVVFPVRVGVTFGSQDVCCDLGGRGSEPQFQCG